MTILKDLKMKRLLICLIVTLSVLPLFSCSQARKVERPNLIVIIIDTLRPDRLGCYGYTKIKTEHIDRIAEEGLLFTEAVCQVPTTSPSHSSIFTGRYPTAHGVRHNGLFKLNESEVTLAEVLRENGFATGAFVGTYVLNSGFGLEQGFDRYGDIKVNASGLASAGRLQEAQRIAEKVNEEFFPWLDSVKDKRFFAWIHYYDPHFPYRPPAGTAKKVEGSGYDSEVSYSDQCLGDLMAKLRELDLLDRSILLFASDHGESLGEHGEDGHGIFLYDCTVRIPLILRAPWIIRGGKEYNGIFETVDIMPTLLGLLGLPVPAPVQGQNLAAEIKDGRSSGGKKESYAESYVPTFEYGWSELKSIRKGGKKFIEAPMRELYDLGDDPQELSNIYSGADTESRGMQEALAAMVSRISDRKADPYDLQQLDDEKIRTLKSLGYLSGEYFKSGEIKKEQQRVDPKLGMEEKKLFFQAAELAGMGRFKMAMDLLREVLQKNPKNYQARLVILKILSAGGDLESALAEAQSAVKIAELDPAAMTAFGSQLWNLYGSLLEKKNDHEGAEGAYRKGLENDSNRKVAFKALADFYMSRQKYDSALEIVDAAAKEDEGNTLAGMYLFKLLVLTNQEERAAEVAAKLAHHDMTADFEVLSQAARLLYERKRFPEAALAYKQLLSVNPADADAAEALGSIFYASGDLRSSEKIFKDLLLMNPRNGQAYYHLGLIALQRDEEPSARENFRKLLSIDPGYYQVHDAMGAWLKKKGRAAEAREEYKKSIALNPADQVAAKELEANR